VFEVDETGARIRTATFSQNLVTRKRGHRRDAFNTARYFLQFTCYLVGGFERAAGRSLNDRVDLSLVFAGDEAGRQRAVDEQGANDEAAEQQHGNASARDDLFEH